MRICLFTPTFLPAVGGAERDAQAVAQGLVERGHGVHVLAPWSRGEMPPLAFPVTRYRRPPSQNLWPEVLAWPLRRLWRKQRFDLVLAFYSYPTGYAAARLGRRRGFPVVATPRGMDLYPHFHALDRPRVRSTIARGYRGADRIVSISQWLTHRLHEVAGPGLPPIDLVPNGLDLARHDRWIEQSRREPPDLPVREPFVLHLARVAPVKRQTLAVEAVARLAGVFRAAKLRYAIVGDGADAGAVRALIEKHAIGDIVKPLGTRVGVEKYRLLDRARFGVTTSREEGFGNVVIEQMAAGLPMLASDIPPHRELLEGRGWGRLFPTGDLDALCAKMRGMIQSDLTPLREAALAHRGRYSLERMIDGYERACRLALDTRRPADHAREEGPGARRPGQIKRSRNRRFLP